MARNLTIDQLNDLEAKVMQEHKLEQGNGIHLYDKRGLKKLDDISWAIYHKMKKVPL